MVRNLGAFVDGVATQAGPVKRWDGVEGTNEDWDELRKDPELWLPKGNCLVYLYGKGQSRRGPSFQLPLQELMASHCYALIERFADIEEPRPKTSREIEQWARVHWKKKVELFIPPPPGADKSQAYHFHLATRNFFAWVFRRSIVGHHLGSSLAGLLHSMHEFRSEVKDNVKDLVDYLDEEGYIRVADRPEHALALLYLAETFQFNDMYIRAFSHCVGMCDQLYSIPEYHEISTTTKKLIRLARADLDSKVYSATDMLRTFLDEELSESQMGITAGARAHLERFRSFLLSYYASHLGYYPPRSFETSLYWTMREDFEALYTLLVDGTYTSEEATPSVASGGLCTLQLVRAFDERHQYEPLDHPMPHIPQFTLDQATRRLAWLSLGSRGDSLRPDQRVQAHAALMKASNWQDKVLRNDLVKAYRAFEEQSVMIPNKADKQEKVTVMEARKVRWILVYAVYQVLRSVTDVPPQVWDVEDASYPVAVSADGLPPWEAMEEEQRLLHFPGSPLTRRQTDVIMDTAATSPSPSVCWADSDEPMGSSTIEIRPEIDYFAITHREPSLTGRSNSTRTTSQSILIPTRSSSLTHSLRRSDTFRRSLRIFKSSSTPTVPEAASSRMSYHEIVVHGYGNGTHSVRMDQYREEAVLDEEEPWGRSAGEYSLSDSDVDAPSPESIDSEETLEDSPVETPSPTLSYQEWPTDDAPKPLRVRRRQDVVSMIMDPVRRNSIVKSSKRPLSMILSGYNSSNSYSEAYEALVEEQRRSFFPDSPELAQHAIFLNRSKSGKSRHQPSQPHIVIEEDDWADMQAFMDGELSAMDLLNVTSDNDVKPAWEQYVDLGGLTDMR